MHDMYIPAEELQEWLNESKSVGKHLLQGYRGAISNMTNDIISDPRSANNSHIVNSDFSPNPKYMMGFTPYPSQSKFILSCLYVFPEHRGIGLGTHLIHTAQQLVKDKAFIQVAVEEKQIEFLDPFYKKQGFKTTGDRIKDPAGMVYQDYFWASFPLKLERVGRAIIVRW